MVGRTKSVRAETTTAATATTATAAAEDAAGDAEFAHDIETWFGSVVAPPIRSDRSDASRTRDRAHLCVARTEARMHARARREDDLPIYTRAVVGSTWATW